MLSCIQATRRSPSSTRAMPTPMPSSERYPHILVIVTPEHNPHILVIVTLEHNPHILVIVTPEYNPHTLVIVKPEHNPHTLVIVKPEHNPHILVIDSDAVIRASAAHVFLNRRLSAARAVSSRHAASPLTILYRPCYIATHMQHLSVPGTI